MTSRTVGQALRAGRRPHRCIGVAVLVFCPASVMGETESEPTSFEHDIVIKGESVEERDRARAFKSSVAATTVTSEKLRSEAPGSLADALRTAAPSVSIQQTTPGQGTIQVRGLSGRAIVYSVDGVRLNMAFFRAGNNDYLGLIDPYSAASVTIVPGAASVEYGSDALGGAVLVNTETPGFSLGQPLTEGRVLQSVGSNPRGTASRVAMSHQREKVAGELGFTYYQAGPIRPGDGVRSPAPASYVGLERNVGEAYAPLLERKQRGTEFEFYAADGTLRLRLDHRLEVVLKGQVSARPELVRYDQVTPRFKSEYPARAERSLLPMSRAMLSATLRQRRRQGLFDQGEIQLAWQRIYERRVDRKLAEICVEPTTEPLIEPEACTGRLRLVADPARTFEVNSSNAFSLRSEARKANETGSISAVVGGELHHDIVGSRTEELDFATRARTARESRYPDGSSVSEGALFAYLRFRVVPGAHLFIGARSSLFFIQMKGREGVQATDAFSRALGDGVGTAGLHWELAPGVAWVLNGARGVRAPNVEDFAALGTRAGGRYQLPNPNVRPEHSYTADTGIKLAKGRHRAHAMVFFSRYADAISLAPVSVAGKRQTPEGDAYFQSVNASSVDLVGAEGSFDLALFRQLSTFARVLVVRGTQYNPSGTGLPAETPADRVPPAQGELGLRYGLHRSLQVEAFAIGRAPQRRLNDPINVDDNRIPEGGTPGYVTYHARLKYVPYKAWVARLSFDNITNELALDHGSGFYRAGFGVTGSVELAFDTAPRN